jgi:hypothetical protein
VADDGTLTTTVIVVLAPLARDPTSHVTTLFASEQAGELGSDETNVTSGGNVSDKTHAGCIGGTVVANGDGVREVSSRRHRVRIISIDHG